MRHIDDPDLKYFSASKVAYDLGMTKSELIARVRNYENKFFFNLPASKELFSVITSNLYGHPINSPPIKSITKVRANFPKSRRMLFITSSEANDISEFGHIEKSEYDAISIYSPSKKEFFSITPKDFYRCESDAVYRKIYDNSEFDFCDYNNLFNKLGVSSDSELESTPFTTIEEPIIVKFDDLLISRSSLEKIVSELHAATVDYGLFVPCDWTSSKLADLNEASTLFFGPKNTDAPPSDSRKDQIRNWFRTKWTKNKGDVLFEYAMLAILPDKYNPQAPLLDDELMSLIEKNNPYASRTLILINKASEQFYKEGWPNLSDRTSKDDTIELEKIYGLNARMAAQAAVIICPDIRSRTLHTRVR